MEIHPIARIHSDFPGKFGIPRQSGLVPELRSRIIFEPEYRNRDAIRGLEDFSHLWLIWEFSETIRGEWSPTVRPPKLGGNKRMGVFATRSPFRPNSLALSCRELLDLKRIKALRHVPKVFYLKCNSVSSSTKKYYHSHKCSTFVALTTIL